MEFKDAQKRLKEALNGKKTIAIGYHPDADGISSTVILLKYLAKTGADNISLYAVYNLHRSLESEHLEEAMTKRPQVLIFVDCAISNNVQLIKLAKRLETVICIDHHSFGDGLEKIPHLYINSKLFSRFKGFYTTSRLIHELLNDPSNDWLSLVGLEGDIGDQTKDVDICETARRLNSAEISGQKNKYVTVLFYSCDAADFLKRFSKDAKLCKLYQTIIKGVKLNMTVLQKKQDEALHIHKIISPHNLELAEFIVKRHIKGLKSNQTFIIYYDWGKELTLRLYTSNPEINCVDIVRAFGGGGHKFRAGVTRMQLKNQTAEEVIKKISARLPDIK